MTELRTVDYHTAGEPFRIVVDPPVDIVGDTVAERRMFARTDPAVDGLRRLLCFEPRGHADMYGGFLVPPDDDGAEFGVLFWHKDGFSTACGHGTIALGAWAVRSGRVAAPDTGRVDVVIDVPSGRVTARVHTESGRVTGVDFVNVASYLVEASIPVETALGRVEVALGFGGALYAQLDVGRLGLTVEPAQHVELIALGREITRSLNATEWATHSPDPRLSGIYGTILFEDHGRTPDGPRQRNVTIFADGQLDRSPCGSGTATRVATMHALGQLGADETLVHESIVGGVFRGSIASRVIADGRDAVMPVIRGTAFPVGEYLVQVDPDDELTPGFVLR